MFNEKIININYKAVNAAIEKAKDLEPIIILMNSETLTTFIQGADDNPDAKVTVTPKDFEEIVTYNDIPISINPLMPYGFIIVK